MENGTTIPRRDFLTKSTLAMSALALPTKVFSKEEDEKINQAAEVKIRRLSWAGIQIEYDGVSLFVDPWVDTDIWDGKWKLPVIDPKPQTETNHVAITHAHNDHWDPKAINAIYGTKRASIFCGPKTAPALASFNLPAIRVSELWEPWLFSSGKFTLIAIPAQDYSAIEQVSWVIKVGGKTIYHGGDSMWHGHFHKVSNAYGPFDIVFLPINGADLLVLQPNSHICASLDPIQATAAAKVLRAGLVVPIHYGMEDPVYYLEYPNAEKVFIEECKRREVKLEIVEPGNWVSWKANK